MTESATILLADDDRAIRLVLAEALAERGMIVKAAADAATLWQWIDRDLGDCVVTDVLMPDGSGLDLLPRIKARRPDLPVIVMSAQNTILTAIRATERGAFDYLPKPFDLAALAASVERALAARRSVARDGTTVGEESPGESLPLIGHSPAMQEVYRIVARLVGTDMTILIHGESGTGKELVARVLHDFGRRRRKPFVAVNMAAIPRELIESELFGHEKGAFTGAIGRGIGKFEAASGGTLFLDEIGDMPLDAQTRLLRVLQSGEFSPIGAREAIKADVRIVAATHRDLERMIALGQFREDLYYRLNVVPLRLPPLRERRADVGDLARHFLMKARRDGLPARQLTPAAIAALQGHDWPGNVRELENLMRRLSVLHDDAGIDAPAVIAALAPTPSPPSAAVPAAGGEGFEAAINRHLDTIFADPAAATKAGDLHARILREVERPLLARALDAMRGNQVRAAELLGLNRNTLRKKLRELDLAPTRREGGA